MKKMSKIFYTICAAFIGLVSSASVYGAGIRKSVAQKKAVPYQWLGRIEASQCAIVRALVPGRVTKKSYRVGQRVKVGDVLLSIKSAAAQKAADAAEAALHQAERNYNNAAALCKKKIGSMYALEQAEVVKKQAVAALESQYEKLEFALVEAPFDGIIYTDSVSEGSMVVTGLDLCQIASVREALVNMHVKASDLTWLKDSKTFQVQCGDQVKKGEWFANDPFLNHSTGTVAVRLKVKGDFPFFGSYVFVKAERTDVPKVHVVDVRALHYENGQVGLLGIEDGVTTFHRGSILSFVDDQVYLTDLPETVTYIAEGHGDFFGGEKINVSHCYAISGS